MRKANETVLKVIVDSLFKQKKEGKMSSYHYDLLGLGLSLPFLITLIWCILENVINDGVNTPVKDNLIMMAYSTVCVLTLYIGIAVGRALLLREQQHERFELIEGIKKRMEEEGVNIEQ